MACAGYLYMKTDHVYYTLGAVIGLYYLARGFRRTIEWFDHRKLQKAKIHDIDNMDEESFEIYLKLLFERMGYLVTLHTFPKPLADLVLYQYEGKQLRYKGVVQVVHEGYIEENHFEIAYKGKHKFKADEVFLVVNRLIPREVHDQAAEKNIKLIDRDKLFELITKY